MPLPIYSQDKPKPVIIENMIAIAAGKGGVGKSTVTVNLALALRSMGYQVGVLDTDIYGPSVRQMLPEDRLPTQKGEIIQPAICAGIKMLSMAYFRRAEEATIVRAPIANGLISQFIKNIDWGTLDFLLFDFPPGTGDIQLTLCQQAKLTGALMVTTPQEVALLDVRKAMKMFDQVHVPILGVIENMSGFIPPGCSEPIYPFGKGGGEKLASSNGVPFLGSIPLDELLCRCGDEGKSIFSLDPSYQKQCTQAFISLAHSVIAHCQSLNQQNAECLTDFVLNWEEMSHDKNSQH